MNFRATWLRFSGWVGLTAFAAISTLAAAAVELYPERSSPFDLEIRGALKGLAAGEVCYLRHADLAALPSFTIKVDGEFTKGEQEVKAVFLDELLKRLPLTSEADTVLAACKDLYASIYTKEFIAQYKPFFVLEINGVGPEGWPPPGLKYNPGPNVITVSDLVAPGVSKVMDIGHKKPWGTTGIEIVNYTQKMKPTTEGRWAKLSPIAQQGEKIWMNSCTSCHQGPNGLWGGTKSQRPFMVVEAIAGYNADYFKKYVRDPKSMNHAALMEAHPHYTDEQLDALIAFITADKKQ